LFSPFLSISKRWVTGCSSLVWKEILIGVVKRSIRFINNQIVHAGRLHGNNPRLERSLERKRMSVTNRHRLRPLVLTKRIVLISLIIALYRTDKREYS